jgi:hypothetical protein
MTTEPFQRADKRLMLIVAVVAALSIAYTVFHYQSAFPEASLDLRLSKTQITALAEKFLREQGLATAGFRNLTLFDPDDEARIYLEREMGLKEANRLMQDGVSVWRWRARWFRPPQQEEMLVYLNPAGAVVGFSHVVPEAAPGAKLSMDSARRLADEFLAGRTRAGQRLVEEQLRERPARYDYVFTWEQEGFRAKDATYRRSIVVQGDRIGQYSEYLYVPEKWKREFATLRSSNELYYQAAAVVYVLLILAAVVVLIQSLRRRVIRWKPLLIIAATVGVLMVVNEWNSIPFTIDSMPTSSPYSQSLLRALLLGLGAGVGVFFYVILAAAPGEPLYRELEPKRLSLLRLPSLRAIKTKDFFLAAVVGYGFAAFHLAFVVAFYIVGRRFGVWSPQDVSYSDFLSTRLPWIYPLTISLLAATSEEFWFRLLAIPLLKRYLRLTWVAVIIPAFLWGFLHATYPQQPGYIRGLEVGIIGVAAGFLMLRFGIVATLVWHYTVDAIMIGMFLFQAGSWYFRLSGLLVGGAVVFPLVVSLIFYKRHGGFVVSPELLNSWQEPRATPAPTEEVTEAAPAVPAAASRWPVKWLYLAAAALALAGLLLPRAVEFGDFIRVRLSRTDAEAAASRELQSRVPNPGIWKHATEFLPGLNTAEFEYVRRLAGSRAANQTVQDRTDTGLWMTRYLQPLHKEEWRVYVDQQGQVRRVDHLLDERAPGARLSPEQARRLAESYLVDKQGIPLDRYRLVDSSTDKKDQRTDYSFVWEDSSFHMGEAQARIALDVLGDEVSGLRRFLKLPEEWLREFRKPRLSSLVIPAGLGAAGLLLLVLFIKRLSERSAASQHRYHWRGYLALAVAGACLSAVSGINQWPLALAGYDTATPLGRYLWILLMGRVIAALVVGFALLLAALAADVFWQWIAGERPLPPASLLRAVAVVLLLWGFSRVETLLRGMIPGPRVSLPLWQIRGPDTFLPAISVLAPAFVYGCLLLLAMIVAVSAAARFPRPLYSWASAVLVALAYAAGQALTPWQFGYHAAVAMLAIGAVIAVVKICGEDLRTYGLALCGLLVAGPTGTLLEQPAPELRWNGVAAALTALAIVLLLVRLPRFLPRDA